MGLLYPFPVSAEETDFVDMQLGPQGQLQTITLKSYGLPYIFWGYAAAIIAVIIFMAMAIYQPIMKYISIGDELDRFIGNGLLVFLMTLPVVLLAFFFYEKRIQRKGSEIIITHRLFWLPVRTQRYQLNQQSPFVLEHFLDSPNMARIKGETTPTGFQNRGYFMLYLMTDNNQKVFLDRHSRKVDLEHMSALLNLIKN